MPSIKHSVVWPVRLDPYPSGVAWPQGFNFGFEFLVFDLQPMHRRVEPRAFVALDVCVRDGSDTFDAEVRNQRLEPPPHRLVGLQPDNLAGWRHRRPKEAFLLIDLRKLPEGQAIAVEYVGTVIVKLAQKLLEDDLAFSFVGSPSPSVPLPAQTVRIGHASRPGLAPFVEVDVTGSLFRYSLSLQLLERWGHRQGHFRLNIPD